MNNTERIATLVFCLIPTFFLENCSFSDEDQSKIVKGEGPVKTMEVELDSIFSISHAGIGDLILIKGPEQKVTIKAQQNIIEYMVFSVNQGLFVWGYKEKISIDPSSEPVTIEVAVEGDIKDIHLAGIGNIQVSGPKQENLLIALTGLGNILCYQLETDECIVNLPGIGNCQIFVNEKLSGLLSGQGTIYYKGNPVIECPITGLGKIINDN